MSRSHRFATSIHELLVERGRDGARREERIEWGVCDTRPTAGGWQIDATDDLDVAGLDSDAIAWLRRDTPVDRIAERAASRAAFARVVQRRVVIDNAHRREETIVTVGDDAIATHVVGPDALDDVLGAIERRRGETPSISVNDCDAPFLFTRGSAAVLFHEAAGHPAELGLPPLDWPRWLDVRDEPSHDGIGACPVDDTGDAPEARDLLRGEMPAARRRRSFRDAPLHRLSNVVVRASGDVAAAPPQRIEIELLAGGEFDSQHDDVTLRVSVAYVATPQERRRMAPFTLRFRRRALPSALLAACSTNPKCYPGVICSSEGAQLAVGSFAPDLLVARTL